MAEVEENVSLASLLTPSKTVTIDYPDIDGFEVDLCYLAREELLKLRNKCLTQKFNKKTRAFEEQLDEDKFLTQYVQGVIKGWKGLTYEDLQELVLKLSRQLNISQNQIQDNQIVIKPGSIGLYARDPSKEVMVVRVFYRPSGLAYEAKFKLNIEASDELSWSRVSVIDLNDVLEIPGETKTGIYNYSTGEVE